MHFTGKGKVLIKITLTGGRATRTVQDRNSQPVGGKKKWNNADWCTLIHLQLQPSDCMK